MLTFDERVRLEVLRRRVAGTVGDSLKTDDEVMAEVRGELLAAAELRGRSRALAPAVSPRPAAVPAAPAAPEPARAAGGSNAALFALARAEAQKVIARWAARGLFPPQTAIADEVAAELRKRGEFGADGKPLTGATFKRHALRGISSATKKAQSTPIKRGK